MIEEELHDWFGNYRDTSRAQAWEKAKEDLVIGRQVSGRVVARRHFGVFLDIGVGFPALLLVTRLDRANELGHSIYDEYPGIGDTICARVIIFSDLHHQIALTQLDPDMSC